MKGNFIWSFDTRNGHTLRKPLKLNGRGRIITLLYY